MSPASQGRPDSRPSTDFAAVFGADLLPRPAYRDVPHRVVGDLSGSDFVMRNVFWIGLYPDLTEEMLDFSATAILEFARRATHASAAR